MGKRKIRKLEIKREEQIRSYKPMPNQFSSRKEYMKAFGEWRIKGHKFYNTYDGEETQPYPEVIKSFRKIIDELPAEEIENWDVEIGEEGWNVTICPRGHASHKEKPSKKLNICIEIYNDGDMRRYKDIYDESKNSKGGSGSCYSEEKIPINTSTILEWIREVNSSYNIIGWDQDRREMGAGNI